MESGYKDNKNTGPLPSLCSQPPSGRRAHGGLRVGAFGICEGLVLTCELCDIKILSTKVKLCKSCGYVVYQLDSCDDCLPKLHRPEKDPDLCYSCAQ
jgi:hypothetical protein